MAINFVKEKNFWGDEYPYAIKEYMKKISTSKRRNIEFEFEFYDWYQWWLNHNIDKNKPYKRTIPYKDTPCMCRKNDMGSYNIDNVYLGTIASNSKDAHKFSKLKCMP